MQSLFVRNLLHVMQLDSMKHLELCRSALSLIRGEDVYKPEHEEMRAGLQRHLRLEGESVKRANQIPQYEWLRETERLKVLIKILRNDERKHHKAARTWRRSGTSRSVATTWTSSSRTPSGSRNAIGA